MPIIHSNFLPQSYLRNGHTQTLLAKYWPRRIALSIQTQRLELNDGDFVDCAWTGSNGPIVIVLHGLEGSLQSHYAQGILQSLSIQGYRAVLMHFRGCSGEANRLARAYHSGDVADLAALVTYIKQHYPDVPLFAIGYSLGGNVLLKWLGEQQQASPLIGAVAVSVPYQLAPCVAHMNQGFLNIYQSRFVAQLKLKIAQKISTHQLQHLQQHLASIKTLHDFDDKVTAPMHGFKNAMDYYTKASCFDKLIHITTPTLLLHAMDDPLIPPHVVPKAENLSNAVNLELSPYGGHVGFIDVNKKLQSQFYLEQRIPNFFKSLHPHQ